MNSAVMIATYRRCEVHIGRLERRFGCSWKGFRTKEAACHVLYASSEAGPCEDGHHRAIIKSNHIEHDDGRHKKRRAS